MFCLPISPPVQERGVHAASTHNNSPGWDPSRTSPMLTFKRRERRPPSGIRFFGVVGLAIAFATSCLASPVPKSLVADAAEKADRPAIHTLLKKHADVNAPQPDGMTALHWATHLDDLEIT